MKSILTVRVLALSALAFASSIALGQDALVKSLLARDQRPKVAEVETLLGRGYLPEFIAKADLPTDSNRPSADTLQNNYPLWFRHLQENAADFIFEIERAYPGAKIAFIGRDMEAIADLTEAFYRNIGQNDRVVRIAMSRGTLENLDGNTAVQYMAQYQIQFIPGQPLRKVLFVDTISGGGGRQGRFLINALSQHYVGAGGSSLDLVRTLGFLGLLGATASIRENPIQNSAQHFQQLEKLYASYGGNVSFSFGEHFPVMTFQDNRKNKYQGFNESGYEHWVGAWHGSYGPLQIINGKLIAVPIETHDELRKKSVLHFQLHIVNFARSEQLINQIRSKAQKAKFEFPGLQIWNPARDALFAQMRSASGYAEIPEIIQRAQSQNSDFTISPSDLIEFWSANIERLQLPIDKASWDLIRKQVDLKNPRAQTAVATALFQNRNTIEKTVLTDFIKIGGHFEVAAAKLLALDQLGANRFELGQKIIESHKVSLSHADVIELVRGAKSFNGAVKLVNGLCEAVGYDQCQETVLTIDTYRAVMKFSAKIEDYKKFFAEIVGKLSKQSPLLLPLLTQDSPIPIIERTRELFGNPQHAANLALLIKAAQSQIYSETETLELLESVLGNSLNNKAADLKLLAEPSIKALLLKHRTGILDPSQAYPFIRSIYWNLFFSTDEDGRAFHLFRTAVQEGAQFFQTFRVARDLLVKKDVSAAELKYFDNLAAEKLIRDATARAGLVTSSWQYLLSQTTIGTSEWIERVAPFLGPARQFVSHMQALQNRIVVTNELFDTFLNFGPTLGEFTDLKRAMSRGWEQKHIKWFAEQHFQNHKSETAIFEMLSSLENLEAEPQTIHEIAQMPGLLSSIQSIDGVNRWLTYFEDNDDAYRSAYTQVLDWIQTPSEFNSLALPRKGLRTKIFTNQIREWRAQKKNSGWKFKWLQSYSAFGHAVDTGAQRAEPCETFLERRERQAN